MRMYPCRWLLTLAAMILLASRHSAQSEESDPASGLPAPTPAAGFMVPDVPERVLESANYHSDRFSIKFGLGILLDYTAFSQDSANIAQVGVQEDQVQVRDFRFIARGHFDLLGHWRYMTALQYKGFAQDPGVDDWQIADLNLTTTLGSLGDLTIGKTKQTYVYEMVGEAANLPQSERLMTPFFRARDVGLRFLRSAPTGRMTFSLGWYNDWLIRGNSFPENGQQFTVRVTGLPVWQEASKHYLHVGVSGRYNGARNDTLRLQGAPESNVSSNFLDTGPIEANHAWQIGLEGLFAAGPVSVLAEYNQAWIASAGNAVVNGWYVVGSWVLTGGGPRPYDRKVGYARRMPVTHRHGEVELVLRYGQVDLDDADVSGGILGKWYAGLNWWATTRWKAGLGYGRANLKKDGLDGEAGIMLTRLQWIF